MLNEKDRKVLKELVKNGRISFADLGRKCHMTRQSVYSRIKSLRNRGIIKNFTVNLDMKKMNLNLHAYVLIEMEPIRHRDNKKLDFVKSLPQITQIHILFGRYGYIIEVMTKDMDELKDIVRKIHDLETVRRTETMIVYKTDKYNPQHPVEGILSSAAGGI